MEAPIQSGHSIDSSTSILFRGVLHFHSWTPGPLHAFLQVKGKTSYDVMYITRTMSDIIYITSEWGIQRNHGSGKSHALKSTIATSPLECGDRLSK